MAIKGIGFQIAWRIDDAKGKALWNKVENLDKGLALPPPPRVGDKAIFNINGKSVTTVITQAHQTYSVDGIINITTTSHIYAREV